MCKQEVTQAGKPNLQERKEECNFSGNILKETDDPEKHKRDMTNMANTIMIMRYQMELLQEELEAKHGTDNAPIDLKQNIRDAKYIMRQYAVQAGYFPEKKI